MALCPRRSQRTAPASSPVDPKSGTKSPKPSQTRNNAVGRTSDPRLKVGTVGRCTGVGMKPCRSQPSQVTVWWRPFSPRSIPGLGPGAQPQAGMAARHRRSWTRPPRAHRHRFHRRQFESRGSEQITETRRIENPPENRLAQGEPLAVSRSLIIPNLRSRQRQRLHEGPNQRRTIAFAQRQGLRFDLLQCHACQTIDLGRDHNPLQPGRPASMRHPCRH